MFFFTSVQHCESQLIPRYRCFKKLAEGYTFRRAGVPSNIDADISAVKRLNFCPREEKNMPYDHKVLIWLDKLALPDEIITDETNSDGIKIVCKSKKPYPVTSSETASVHSDEGKEQHYWRSTTREALKAYREENERVHSVFAGKRDGPSWKYERSEVNGGLPGPGLPKKSRTEEIEDEDCGIADEAFYDYRDELSKFGGKGAYYSTELNVPLRRSPFQ